MFKRPVRARLLTLFVLPLLAVASGGCSTTCKKAAPADLATATATAEAPPDIARGDAEPGTQPIGAPCGGEHGACDATSFCRFPADAPCGDNGATGVCEARPTGCHRDCPGVCGCNGTRFCNSCVAEARGYSIRHKGACKESPDVAP